MKFKSVAVLFVALLGVSLSAQTVGASYYNDNNGKIYFFSKDGGKYTTYDGKEKKWTDWANTSGFANGKGEIKSIGASFYNAKNDLIYVFSLDGKDFSTYDGASKTWSKVKNTSGFGDGKNPVPQVGAAFYNENNDQIYLFSIDGKKYTTYDGKSKEWREVKPVSAFANGKCPLTTIGATFYNKNNDQIYLFDIDGTSFTVWDGATKTWRDVKKISAFADGKMPELK